MSCPLPIRNPQAACENALTWAASFQLGIEHCLVPYSEQQHARISQRPRLKRSIDFAMGRRCARVVLSRLGVTEHVGVKASRAPNWPPGVVGSISHSDQIAWAASAKAGKVRAIGIDTESVVDSMTRHQLLQEVLTPAEWECVQPLSFDEDTLFTLAFSAKESFYKAWSSLTGQFFDFRQATICAADDRRVVVQMQESNPNFGMQPNRLNVEYLIDQTEVFTATWMV